jgi:histidinol-phosphatase (PHP family)
MIKTNWHTHTARCGHAAGTDEEYVLCAIKGGIKTLGFSDHAAYREPSPGNRMDLEMVPDYIQSVRALGEKYKDQIQIHLGMEVEYYPDQWEELTWYRKNLDFCILGQHRITYDGPSIYRVSDSDNLMAYVDALEEGCRHGLADYICHPDVVLWSYPGVDETVLLAAERIADISVRYNMPLELNAGSGVHRGKREFTDGVRYAYPVRAVFEVFARKKCPVIIGLDIHNPVDFLEDTWLNKALSVTEGLDLKFLDDFDLVSAAAKRKEEFF